MYSKCVSARSDGGWDWRERWPNLWHGVARDDPGASLAWLSERVMETALPWLVIDVMGMLSPAFAAGGCVLVEPDTPERIVGLVECAERLPVAGSVIVGAMQAGGLWGRTGIRAGLLRPLERLARPGHRVLLVDLAPSKSR